MSMTVTGRAAIYGADGQIVYTGVAALSCAQFVDDVTFSHSASKEEIRDGSNELMGYGWSDKRDHVTINFTPVASSTNNTLANAATACKLPDFPVQVALSGFKEPSTNAINGNWIYDSPESASLKYTKGGKASMTLQLWRPKGGDDTRVAALVATAS